MPDGVRGGDGQWWWYHSRAGIISQRFGITCTSQSLLLQSISPLLLSLCVYITRITLFVMSSLIPPPVHAHIPYCVFLLSGPGSDSFFRVRASGSDFIFRVRAPGSHSFSPAPAPSVLPLSSPSSDCPKTHAPFPPSPHFVFFRELNIHHSNSISVDIQQNDISSNVIIMY